LALKWIAAASTARAASDNYQELISHLELSPEPGSPFVIVQNQVIPVKDLPRRERRNDHDRTIRSNAQY